MSSTCEPRSIIGPPPDASLFVNHEPMPGTPARRIQLARAW